MSAFDDITRSLTEHRLNEWYFQRWQRDNKIEAPKVLAYLDGGSRPSDSEVLTHYGRGLLFAEDARRELAVPDPPPPPTESGYDFPAKYQVFGVSTEDAKDLDFAITSFVTDCDPRIARQVNPGLTILSHPAIDPFNPDACFKRGFAWTYGSGLIGGSAGVACRDAGKTFGPFPGANDALAPNPQGQIRSFQTSDIGCTQGDGLKGFALWQPATATLLAQVIFYGWKIGKFHERGFDGVWSDNLIPGNLIHAGWFYGTCASDPARRAAWDQGLLTIVRHVRSKAEVPIRLGGNMLYRTDNTALRTETNVALRELVYDYKNPAQQPMGFSTVDALWSDILSAQAWRDVASIDGQAKLLGVNAQVLRTDLKMQRAVAAVACIYGASFNCYDGEHGNTFWPDVTFKDGKRGYLGRPTGAPQRSGGVLSRQFEHGKVTYDHMTKNVTFA